MVTILSPIKQFAILSTVLQLPADPRDVNRENFLIFSSAFKKNLFFQPLTISVRFIGIHDVPSPDSLYVMLMALRYQEKK